MSIPMCWSSSGKTFARRDNIVRATWRESLQYHYAVLGTSIIGSSCLTRMGDFSTSKGIIPNISSVCDLLRSIALLSSLHRLKTHTNQSDEKKIFCRWRKKMKQLVLHACSYISWNDLSYKLPFSTIRVIEPRLSFDNVSSFNWFSFPQLSYICQVYSKFSIYVLLELQKHCFFLLNLS